MRRPPKWCTWPSVAFTRASILLLSLGVGGCRSCKNEHPYVPYAIGDDGGAQAQPSAAQAPSAAPAADGGAFAEEPAERAPQGAREWTFGGVRVSAPVGQSFEQGVARDLDGDGALDVAAIVREIERPASAGTLVFYKGSPRGVAEPITPLKTGPLPEDAACTPTRRLAVVGRHSVLLELGAKCPLAPAHEPSRFIAVVAFAPQPRVHFSASVVDPPGAPSLLVEADGSDRDADGIDDVAVRVALEGGGAPLEPLLRASATLVWFDRPAGMSREEGEPDAALRGLAAAAASLAARAKDAHQVAPKVRAVRAVYDALCAEGGSPRLLRVSADRPLSCGVSRALEEAGLAEVRALATLGAPIQASAALVRAQLSPATKTASRTHDAETWILQVSPPALATALRQVAAVPMIERAREPSWGALAFEPGGTLLVRTAVGVVRVDPETGDEADARDVAPWSMAVVSPDGASRFVAAYNACDGSSLHATIAPTGDGQIRDVVLPIAPPPGARCVGGKGDAASAVALAWGPSGLEAIVGGVPVLVSAAERASLLQSPLSQPVSLGSPRAPGGKLLVLPTPLGLIVEGAKSRTLRARELDGAYGELRDCTVSDDGKRAACVRAGHAWVGVWP